MLTVEQVREAIKNVMDPELHRSLVELGMVKDITVEEGKVRLTLALTTPGCPKKQSMVNELKLALVKLPEVKGVSVQLAEMTEEEKRRAFGATGAARCQANPSSQIGQVVAVMSGKGGVGKSMVSALLAVTLARQGKRVGVLDADITGPSIPRMFGLHQVPEGDETGIIPVTSKTGIKVMSMNLLLPEEDSAVIWRGPMLSSAIKQLWENVRWGQLDYLIVDLPPGTADVPLTVLQSLPVAGVVLVSSPQELVGMVVRKALHLTTAMKTPIIGVVENMSYYMCPDTGKKHEVFGPSRAEELATSVGSRVLATLPIDSALAKASDEGAIEEYHSADYELLGKRFVEVVTK